MDFVNNVEIKGVNNEVTTNRDVCMYEEDVTANALRQREDNDEGGDRETILLTLFKMMSSILNQIKYEFS